MPMVEITVNGRRHSVQCGPGEETRVKRLAAYIDRKVTELAADKTQVGDARLMLLASLVVADELSDAYDEIQRLQNGGAQGGHASGDSERRAAAMIERVAQQLDAVAAELERT